MSIGNATALGPMTANPSDFRSTRMTDSAIAAEILVLQDRIERWVRRHDLWHDCGFKSYLDHFDAPPWSDNPMVTVFYSDGDFNRIFDGTDGSEELYEGFASLLKEHGYDFTRDTGLVYVYAVEPTLNENFQDYFHWQWICSLIKPDFIDIHHEVFEHFENNPHHFQKLNGWDFQVLIYEVLRNQGFRVELGPRSGDGGIDMRMYQRDPIGDILTAVQVKRYRADRKIELEAVQALHGARMAERMGGSMFVTTSDYLPSSTKFAARKNVSMALRNSRDVLEWCEQAKRGILENKAALVSREYVENRLRDAMQHPQGRIVRSHIGNTVSLNSFAVVLKEAKHAALLMELPGRVVSDDGYGQRGLEVPAISLLAADNHKPAIVFRAKKRDYGYQARGTGFWTGHNLYTAWDGSPCHFDLCD